MLPNAPFAFFILLALLPGWIFVRLAEKLGPRPDRSQLAELLELAAVGFSTLAVSTLILTGLSLRVSWLFDVESWAHTRHNYLGNHLDAALLSTALTVLLSCILVVVLWRILYGRRPAGFRAGSSVWIECLAPAPRGMCNWVGVHRKDGSLVEGLMHCFAAGPDDAKREISLRRPIRFTPVGGIAAPVDIHRIMISGDEIAAITVVHVPNNREADDPIPLTAPLPSSS
jgi:Family of unknown function (DUF6338)